MGNSIGGNLEISAIMDASGIQMGADRGQQSMQNLSASAERMAANLAGVGSETVAMTSSLSNAAKMVELLSAKMLANDPSGRSRGGRQSSMISGMSDAGSLQAEKAAYTARMNEYTAWVRQQETAADARDRATRLNARMNGAQNAITRNPLQPMEDAILRMRAQLNPMVGMQARLASEALEFRQHMNNAVISGRLNWENAQRLTAEFREQQILLRQHADQQQQGFLGMRRMGFAAQQFGYAIEDAASVWGTMGMAGAFRAAGNNLTAMGALMGPQVGILTSLAAAGVSLGINLYNAKQAAEELVEENKKLVDLTERINTRELYLVELSQQALAARTATAEELLGMYDAHLQRVREISAAEEARLNTEEKLVKLTALQGELSETNRKIAEDDAKWWLGQFRWSLGIWEYVRDAGSGLMSLTRSEESARLADEKFNQEARIAIEMAHQESTLKRINAEEKTRVEQAASYERLQQRSRAIDAESATEGFVSGGSGLGRYIGENAAYRGEYDVRRTDSMLVRRTEYAGPLTGAITSVAGNDESLSLAQERLLIDERRLQAEHDATRNLEEQARLQAEMVGLSEERLRVDKMRAELNKAGQQAEEDLNRSNMNRFEGLNEELRIQNEIERAQRAAREQVDLAVRSGHMSVVEGRDHIHDLDRALDLEQDRRENLEEIEKLSKEARTLEGYARHDLQPATALGGLQRGSDEARAFLENERLKSMAQNESEPVVAELRRVRAEIKSLREANERVGTSRPRTAAIF